MPQVHEFGIKIPKLKMHLKKVGGYIGQNVVKNSPTSQNTGLHSIKTIY